MTIGDHTHHSATIAATATAIPPYVLTREDVKTILGQPDYPKQRETTKDGLETEDWIYGTPPARTTFVTFIGDKVVRVKEFD